MELEIIERKMICREVDYQLVTLKVIEYVQLCHGCTYCKQIDEPYPVAADVPVRLMKYSPAQEHIIAWIIYQKFANGLTQYRHEKDWIQLQFELSRTIRAS